MRVAWSIAVVVAVAAAAYSSMFPLAELFTEVVILRTYDAAGLPHETRVTVIDRDGVPWVRGSPRRGWFRRIEANPRAGLYRGGAWQEVRAAVSRDPADAAAFDQVMFDTYGLVYRYVDVIIRITSTELPVRLVPASPRSPEESPR